MCFFRKANPGKICSRRSIRKRESDEVELGSRDVRQARIQRRRLSENEDDMKMAGAIQDSPQTNNQ